MLVTGLNIHPVKSTAIRGVASAEVAFGGLVGDRTWMIVDADGVLVSAREQHSLFTITPDTPGTDPSLTSALRLRAVNLPDLLLDEPRGDLVRAKVHSQELHGISAGPEADTWLQTAAGRSDLHLVWCDDPTRRTLNPEHSRPEDYTAYADAYPVTIASESSLRQLNDWISDGALDRGDEPPTALPMQRFRPNLVVDGEEPFAEDHWSSVTVGEVRFRVAKATDRCVMTTIDPDTLVTSKEPIRTLARHRLVDHKTMFALHLIPESTGPISVGDPVRVT